MTWLGLGILVQIVADAVVGVRLLALGRRTRQLPELAFGSACLLLGVVGLPLSIAGRNGAIHDPGLAGVFLATGFAFQDVASFLLFLGTWRIFREGRGWARGLVVLAGLAFIASWIGQALTVGYRGGIDSGFWYEVGFAARAGAFVWAGLESFLYHQLLRRRQKLGLADPVVADRLRLWFLCNAGIVLAFGVFLWARALGLHPAATPWVLATTSLVGIGSGMALWLAFSPPPAYLRWLRARAPSQAASGSEPRCASPHRPE